MKNVIYLLLSLIGAVSIGGVTVGLAVVVGAVIERYAGSSNLGLPYQVGVSIAGASLALFVLYCGYLLSTRWSSFRLFRALRFLVILWILVAVLATAAFGLNAGMLNIVSVLWLGAIVAPGLIVLVLLSKFASENKPD